jgi:nitrogen regulatory protein PII
MKKVEAILSSHCLDQIKEVLFERGCDEIVVSDVRHPCSRQMNYRGLSYLGDAPRVKIEVIVSDADAGATVEAILQNVAGGPQDQRVSIAHVESVVRIGESMPLADAPLSRKVEQPTTPHHFISHHTDLSHPIH